MANNYRDEDNVMAPARTVEAVKPGTDFTNGVARGVYVGGAGNVELAVPGSGNVVFTGFPAGRMLPVRCTQVVAANTTATNMVALF